MNVDRCIEKFVAGKDCKASRSTGSRWVSGEEGYPEGQYRVRAEGGVLWSFDQPIAKRLSDGSLILDCRRFSMRTDQHQEATVGEARRQGVATQCGYRGVRARSYRRYAKVQHDPVDYGEREYDLREIWRHVEWANPPDIAALTRRAGELHAQTYALRKQPGGWTDKALDRQVRALWRKAGEIEKRIARLRKQHPLLKELRAWALVAEQVVREEKWAERKAAAEEKKAERKAAKYRRRYGAQRPFD